MGSKGLKRLHIGETNHDMGGGSENQEHRDKKKIQEDTSSSMFAGILLRSCHSESIGSRSGLWLSHNKYQT